jgi:hypothetical protein
MRAAVRGLWATADSFIFVAVGLSSCGRSTQTESAGGTTAPAQPAVSDSSPNPPEASLVMAGVIYVAGSEPSTVLTLRSDTGHTLGLEGTLTGELRRLSGARVEVRGALAQPGPADRMIVNDYTILEVDGQRPFVGILASSNGRLWLVGQDSLALSDPQGRLEMLAGSKVWVVADTTVSPAPVQAYGVIREPAR